MFLRIVCFRARGEARRQAVVPKYLCVSQLPCWHGYGMVMKRQCVLDRKHGLDQCTLPVRGRRKVAWLFWRCLEYLSCIRISCITEFTGFV